MKFERDGEHLVVKLEGKLDLNTSDGVQKELLDNMAGVTSLVLDLEKLTYISSAGIRVLITVYKMLEDIGGKLSVINVDEDVYDILEVSGFTDIADVASS